MATALVGLAVLSGSAAWIMLRARAGIVTAVSTAVFGALVGAEVLVGSVGDESAAILPLAGFVVAPVALATYPRVQATGSRREPLLVLLVVVPCGIACLFAPRLQGSMSVTIGLALLFHGWWVIERGEAQARVAMLWTAVVTGFSSITIGLLAFTYEATEIDADGAVLAVLVIALCAIVPPAMAVGVMNPDVVDVRWLVTSLGVALTVVICFIATATIIVSGVEMLGGGTLPSSVVIAICGVLALAVAPARTWLYGTVEQLLFGGRPDPIAALVSMADRMGDDLEGSLDTVRTALVVPYLRLEVEGSSPTVSGEQTPHVTVIDLDVTEGRTGRLVVGHRAGERSWSRADQAVLGLVAPLLARTVRAQLLADQLAASRSETVAAIEEERRRLRRDLHDGLGPTLSGVAFSADAARNLVEREPAEAVDLLVRLRADTADAIAEVRRLVEGLRPPALDELGLVGALRTWATGLHAAGGTRLAVCFEGEEWVGQLSAAGEVAAYRIAVEALTNVARHSGSSLASVRFDRLQDRLVLEVRDGGIGGVWSPGVGLSAMRERAELVGGQVEIGNGRVRATLPAG